MKNPHPLLSLLLASSAALAQPQLAPNAPQDQVQSFTKEKIEAYDRAIGPYVAEARKTYPEAKKRFLSGLPPKHTFFITTRLHDNAGKWEQVFIAVERINGDKITGLIWNDVNRVSGFKHGDHYTFSEAELLDWLISKPDGTEEGNFVGKFLDTYKP